MNSLITVLTTVLKIQGVFDLHAQMFADISVMIWRIAIDR